jgi:hypothetical protein
MAAMWVLGICPRTHAADLPEPGPPLSPAGKIVSWLKGPGDKVKKGESIVVSSRQTMQRCPPACTARSIAAAARAAAAFAARLPPASFWVLALLLFTPHPRSLFHPQPG